jgi:hypothetical protein
MHYAMKTKKHLVAHFGVDLNYPFRLSTASFEKGVFDQGLKHLKLLGLFTQTRAGTEPG